jgi:hypothetical protein
MLSYLQLITKIADGALKPARNQAGEFVAVPDGHPHGTYEYSQAIKRRSMAELKILAKGYADRYNAMLWPQENGYTEKYEYAERAGGGKQPAAAIYRFN